MNEEDLMIESKNVDDEQRSIATYILLGCYYNSILFLLPMQVPKALCRVSEFNEEHARQSPGSQGS